MKETSSFWKTLSCGTQQTVRSDTPVAANPFADSEITYAIVSQPESTSSSNQNSRQTTRRTRRPSLTRLLTESVVQLFMGNNRSNNTSPSSKLPVVEDITCEGADNGTEDDTNSVDSNQIVRRPVRRLLQRSCRRPALTSAFSFINTNIEDGSSFANFDSARSSNASSVCPAVCSRNPAMDRPISLVDPKRTEGYDPYPAVKPLSGPLIAYNGQLDSRFPRFEPVWKLHTGGSYSGHERRDLARYFRSHGGTAEDETWQDTDSEVSSVHWPRPVSQLVRENTPEAEPRSDNGEGPSENARAKQRAITPPLDVNHEATNNLFFGNGIPLSPPNHTIRIRQQLVVADPNEACIQVPLAEQVNQIVQERDRLRHENKAYEQSLHALRLLMQEQVTMFTNMQARLHEKEGRVEYLEAIFQEESYTILEQQAQEHEVEEDDLVGRNVL